MQVNHTPNPVIPIPTEEQLRSERITTDRQRIIEVLMKLRKQVANPVRLDMCLSCLTPATAVVDRIPFTINRVNVKGFKLEILNSTIGRAIMKWGELARGEKNKTNPDLVEIERIAEIGWKNFGAYPIERNSAIFVLRTAAEERIAREKRAEAETKALELRDRIREGESEDTTD